MNTKTWILVSLIVLFVAPILFAEDYKEEISVDDAKKAYCATWFVETGHILHKLVYQKDGTYGYYYENAEKPNYSGTFKIEKAWKDSKNNTWLIVWLSYPGGPWSLNRISEDGHVRERVIRSKLNNLPPEIDPNDGSYVRSVLNRKE